LRCNRGPLLYQTPPQGRPVERMIFNRGALLGLKQ